MYLALKLAHILCAILAIGCNLTYGAWFSLGAREPEHLAFTLRGVKFLDDKISNPAWLGVGVTGRCWPGWPATLGASAGSGRAWRP